MNKIILSMLGSIYILLSPINAKADHNPVVTTPEAITSVSRGLASCLRWELRGICVWLKCGWGCSVNTTLKVRNYVPDLLVQTYNRKNGEPWDYSQQLIQTMDLDEDSSYLHSLMRTVAGIQTDGYDIPNSVDIAGGTRTTGRGSHKSSLSFYYVDAFGHPGIYLFNTLANIFQGNFCQSKATAFYPYYNSNLDLAGWRWNYPEVYYPRSWLVGFDLLGGTSNNWGSIFPRQAFSVHQDPLKSSVLKTFRAMHFITGNDSQHLVLRKLDHRQQSSRGWWPHGPLDQDDRYTGQFQMVYPQEDTSCHSFPYNGSSTHESRRSSDANYVWNFWKAYKCCRRDGQWLLFHFG